MTNNTMSGDEKSNCDDGEANEFEISVHMDVWLVSRCGHVQYETPGVRLKYVLSVTCFSMKSATSAREIVTVVM